MQGSGRAIAATIIVVMGATTVAATIPHGKAPVVRAERTVIGPPMGSDLLKLMTATTSSTTVVPTTTTVPPVTIEPTTEVPPPPPVPVVKAPPPVAAPEPAPEPVAPVAPPVAPKPVPVDTSGSLSAVVDFALAQLGDAYLWAGNGPDQWDCSGLMVAAYRQIGITIPRTTWGQAVTGYGVSLANVLPGDLIIFNSDQSHVGMAINAHEVVHAPQAGDVVKVTAIKYMGVVSTIRRIVG